jgi:hypothetical protein
MQSNLLPVIGIGLAAMFFGYFFGLIEGRGQGYKKGRREEAEEKEIQPPVIAPPPPKENSLLKLSLDDSNQFRLDLDGRNANVNALAPEQRKRLIDLMVAMRPWIDASAPKPPQPAAPQPLPAAPVATPVPQAAPKPIAPVPVVLTKKDEPAAPATMVGQIEAILQTHLANSPLANRGIRLVEAPGGTVIVMDGMNKYGSVGEVPDPQVQAVIRAAIAEWEKKYTPGG